MKKVHLTLTKGQLVVLIGCLELGLYRLSNYGWCMGSAWGLDKAYYKQLLNKLRSLNT